MYQALSAFSTASDKTLAGRITVAVSSYSQTSYTIVKSLTCAKLGGKSFTVHYM